MIKFLKTVELRGTSETSKVRPYAITVKLHSDKDFLPLLPVLWRLSYSSIDLLEVEAQEFCEEMSGPH